MRLGLYRHYMKRLLVVLATILLSGCPTSDVSTARCVERCEAIGHGCEEMEVFSSILGIASLCRCKCDFPLPLKPLDGGCQ